MPTTCPVHDVRDFDWPSIELNQCPFPFYDAIRSRGGVYAHPERDEYLVASHALIREVLRDAATFRNDVDGEVAAWREAALGAGVEAPPKTVVTPGNLPVSDAPEHTHKRRMARLLVDPARLRTFEPVIAGLVDELVDTFIDRGSVEFCSEFANPLAFNLICAILGFDRREADVYWSKGDPSTGHGARYLSAEELERLHSRPNPDAFLEAQILARHERPTDDFLSDFIQAHVAQDGALKLDYLKAETALLLRAGNETTARMIASTMRLLLENSEQMQQVVADRSLVAGLIEESLRLEAPTQWVTRRCTTETQLGDVTIPAGALVVLLYASANRDEQRWGDDAPCFHVDRPDTMKGQMAFGAGPHFCLGAPIARMEGRIAYEILLARMANIRPEPGRNDFANIDNIQKRAPKRLYLTFDRA